MNTPRLFQIHGKVLNLNMIKLYHIQELSSGGFRIYADNIEISGVYDMRELAGFALDKIVNHIRAGKEEY